MQSEWGHALRVTVFGASHEKEIGVQMEGLPKGLPVDTDTLQAFLNRRRPGSFAGSTERKEPDMLVFRTGIKNGKTDGTPLIAVLENRDVSSAPYTRFHDVPRPSQIDWPARLRFGDVTDLNGGGHFSGRMTAVYCIAGGIALQALKSRNVTVAAHLLSVSAVHDRPFDAVHPDPKELSAIAQKPFPVLDDTAGEAMQLENLPILAGFIDAVRHQHGGSAIRCQTRFIAHVKDDVRRDTLQPFL